ncbi:MAG: SAM-dependent methyltransferase [Bacteroidota bacterium]
MENRQLALFLEKVRKLTGSRELVRLVIAKQRNTASDLKSVIVTIVEIKAGLRLNFIYRYQTKDITKNFSPEEGLAVIKKCLEEDFLNAELFAAGETIQLTTASRGKIKIKTTRPVLKPAASFSHDHVKERLISTDQNIYLRELGVLNAGFEVRHEMSDKYLQINRYIELIGPVIGELTLPDGFHVVDMGSGKGYLTFALYDFLTNKLGKNPVMTGIESRAELVNLSNDVAGKSGFGDLHFRSGNIADVAIGNIDILIALHACDTATDDAIFRGITSGASLIVCAPCCHKQIRKEFNVTGPLKSVLKHGILEERQAEIITDGLRAMIMESQGYQTRIFEFISTEHTPKNLLIVGKRVPRDASAKRRILDDIIKIKELYGIGQHRLERLLEKVQPGAEQIAGREE